MIRAFLVMLAMLAMPHPAGARPLETAEAEARFVQDSADHRQARARVGAMRGASASRRIDSWSAGDPASVALVAQLLTERGYPAGSAVLFYALRDGMLATYLIGTGGLIAADLTQVTAQSVDQAIETVRATLGVDSQGVSRAAQFGPPTNAGKPVRAWPREARRRVKRAASAQMHSLSGADRVAYDKAAAALSALLLPEAIAAQLGQVRHIAIVADGAIGSAPFAALPVLGKGQLVDLASVSVSAGLYDVSRPIAAWPGRAAYDHALIVGNPGVPRVPGWRIPSLPGAEGEARTLGKAIGVDPIIGLSATKTAVQAAARQASLLYIAAHGSSDPEKPLDGGLLMLAGTDRASAFWTAREIQEERLTAHLAVLSACQTGLGQNVDGGVIGLARAFHLAGVPRVVMSLWSVDDDATAYLMERFNAHAATMMPAEALRLAMIDARARDDDPTLWAAFTLFGTPR